MIYYSHRTRKALAEGRTFLPLGFAHYSYGSVCRSFTSAFEDSEIDAQEVQMPEIYASPAHIFPQRKTDRCLHVAFKPFDEIRLLKGAVNVAHVYWEFGKLPQAGNLPQDHPHRANIMNDYVHALGMVDEVWVGCTYTKKVFEAHGISNIQVVPAPIIAGGQGRAPQRQRSIEFRRLGCLELSQRRVQALLEHVGPSKLDGNALFKADDCIAAGGRVFLSVFNPGDPRKNVAAMILGFQDFIRRTKRNDLLIIKLVIDDQPSTLRLTLTDYLPNHFASCGIPFSYVDCSNIILVPERLSEKELGDLYSLADFYLCTSAAEGQGLPVQEAMAVGVVPISPKETAMLDYIRDDNAIVLNASEAPLPSQVVNAYALDSGTWRIVDYREVSRGLVEAVELTPAEYARRSQAAATVIKAQYGRKHITGRVLERLKEIGR